MDSIILEVSREKYQEALDGLGEKLDKLKTLLQQLKTKRSELQQNYKGDEAETAINVIIENEIKVQEAIEKVIQQKQKIEDYLNAQDEANRDIKASYKEAAEKAASVFD